MFENVDGRTNRQMTEGSRSDWYTAKNTIYQMGNDHEQLPAFIAWLYK